MPIRVKAFLVHILISAVIFSAAFLIAAWVWYPEYYYSANGVWKATRTVAMVDLVLGPLLTLILYKPGKPGLKFDLSMIVVMQLSALMWGVWVLMSQRPVLTVYDQGIFYCLSPGLAKAAQARPEIFQDPRVPVALAYLPPPANAEESLQRQQIMQQLPPGVPGVPAYVFGQYFQAISPDIVPVMLPNELVVTDALLKKYPDAARTWQDFLARHEGQTEHFAYFSLSCSPEDHLAAVDKRSGLIVDALPFPSLTAYKKQFWEQIKDKQ